MWGHSLPKDRASKWGFYHLVKVETMLEGFWVLSSSTIIINAILFLYLSRDRSCNNSTWIAMFTCPAPPTASKIYINHMIFINDKYYNWISLNDIIVMIFIHYFFAYIIIFLKSKMAMSKNSNCLKQSLCWKKF